MMNILPENETLESFVEACKSQDVSDADVYIKLMTLLSNAEQTIHISSYLDSVDILRQLSSITRGLRNHTQDQDAYRYFYYGVFQSELDHLKDSFEHSLEDRALQKLAKRKHFFDIMKNLFENSSVKQADLAKATSIYKSNMCNEMKEYVRVGFVDSKQMGRFKYYSLTPKGRRYCIEHLNLKE